MSQGSGAPGPWTFTDLLRHVHDVPGIKRVRFATSHPRYFTERLVRACSELDKAVRVLPHSERFSLVLQQGDQGLCIPARHQQQHCKCLSADASAHRVYAPMPAPHTPTDAGVLNMHCGAIAAIPEWRQRHLAAHEVSGYRSPAAFRAAFGHNHPFCCCKICHFPQPTPDVGSCAGEATQQ